MRHTDWGVGGGCSAERVLWKFPTKRCKKKMEGHSSRRTTLKC